MQGTMPVDAVTSRHGAVNPNHNQLYKQRVVHGNTGCTYLNAACHHVLLCTPFVWMVRDALLYL